MGMTDEEYERYMDNLRLEYKRKLQDILYWYLAEECRAQMMRDGEFPRESIPIQTPWGVLFG